MLQDLNARIRSVIVDKLKTDTDILLSTLININTGPEEYLDHIEKQRSQGGYAKFGHSRVLPYQELRLSKSVKRHMNTTHQ